MSDLDRITQVSKELANYIGTQVGHYGPKAYEILLEITRINAVGEIVSHIFLAILALVLGFIYIPKSIKWAKLYSKVSDTASFMVPVIISFLLVLTFAVNSGPCFSIWNWVGVFRPDLSLAHQIVLKALDH